MDNNYTHISFVLDRSGSMDSVRGDTIGGFNSFLKEQQKEKGRCTFSMIQFDTEYETLYEFLPIKSVKKLTEKTFSPRGCTALLDAIGKTIDSTGKELAAMEEKDRPGKVLFVILTDGIENASTEFTREKIFEMITHQTENYKWNFIFLGANQDAIEAGTSIGVKAGNSLSFSNSADGNDLLYAKMSQKVSGYRGMSSVDYSAVVESGETFTEEDRIEQEELIKKGK